jgi:NAD(P)-dependent dehydrogenase (short-subunit alcohol dehydrogenase family)
MSMAPITPAPSSLLEGKVATVTMSTGGIGLEVARQLGQAGARAVIVNGRSEAKAAATLAELRAAAPETDYVFVMADVSDPPSQKALFDAAEAQFGGVDILVHAGRSPNPTGGVKPFLELAPEKFEGSAQGYFLSLIYACHYAAPQMVRRGGGAILAILSDAAKIPTAGEAVVGGALAGAAMFIRTLAKEMARHQVRANALTPSLVRETQAYDNVMAQEFSRKIFEKAERRAALGLPTPRDIAPLAVFLCGPLSAHLTGQVVTINGGLNVA